MKHLAVLLPTYNAALYIRDSINSILNQTFSDFDLYIYDDFSSDSTEEIVSSYDDKRIYYRKNLKNIGIARTLNRGLEELLPNYKFIARMDADDWSFPQRFEQQLNLFSKDKDLILCGTQGYWVKSFVSLPLNPWKYPLKHLELKISLLFSSSFGHSSIIFSSQFFLKNKLKYNESFHTCEDWDLWVKVVESGRVANSSQFLMKYKILSFSNHRNPERREKHLEERSLIISNHWRNFGQKINPRDVYCFLYSKKKIKREEFLRILNMYIAMYNYLDFSILKELESSSKEAFRYRFVRSILNFWRNTGQSRFSPFIWSTIFSKVLFSNKMQLVKNLTR